METLNYRFEQGTRRLPAAPQVVGVVGSGNLEVLIESVPQDCAHWSHCEQLPGPFLALQAKMALPHCWIVHCCGWIVTPTLNGRRGVSMCL